MKVPQHLERFKSLIDYYGRSTGDEATKQYGQLTDLTISIKVLAFTLGDPTSQHYRVTWPEIIAPLLRTYLTKKEWILEIANVVRNEGKVKQGILIASQFFAKDEIANILDNFPITQLVKYADMARKQPEVFGGLGRRKKEAIEKILNTWSIRRNEFQAIKYTEKMRQLLKLVHPKPADPILGEIWGWVVKKANEPPTERIKAAEKIKRKEVDAEQAIQLALEYNLPWELIRSHINVSAIPTDLFKEAVRKIMTPIDRAMQANLIVRKLGEYFITDHLNDLYRDTNLYYLAKMALGLYKQKMIDINTGYSIADEIHYRLPDELKERQLVLDGSGSMEKYWRSGRIREIGLALVPRGEAIIFSIGADEIEVDFEWWAKRWKRDVEFLGTCISCGLELASSKALLITDEQHNTYDLTYDLRKSSVEDLVYIVVGTYSSSILPELIAGPRKITIGFGDTMPAIVATLQFSSLVEKEIRDITPEDLGAALYRYSTLL